MVPGMQASWAQEPERPEIDLQEFVEQMFQIPDLDINYEDLYESLYQLYTDPIDLNNTNANELNALYQLNIYQINNLLDYLENHGPMLSLYELQSIEGFDRYTIDSILPFVEVRASGDHATRGPLLKRIVSEQNNFLLLKTERILETQKGYRPPADPDDSRYMGSPYKFYGRFRASHTGDFSVGLTFEKDAGEQFKFSTENKQFGFDYYSYHLYLQNNGNFSKIAIGDYQMQFGQGLVLGSGFNPGKGAETITTVKRGNSGLRPYTSVLESGFLRGAAFTYTHKGFDFTPFYSRLKQDGTVRLGTQSDEFDEFVSSIQDIGMHRTPNELRSRNSVTEQTFGMNVTFNDSRSKNFQAGLNYIRTNFSVPLSKLPNNYNQFEFRGDQNYNLGAFVNYNWHNFLIFSELAASKSGGKAFVGGFMGSLSPIVSMSFVYRNYQKNYHAFYGNAFAEGSRIINETGMYWGIKVTPTSKFFIAAYYDRFKFPWLRFRAQSPTDGYEYLIRANYHPSRKIKIYGQFRQQSKELTTSTENSNLQQLVVGLKRNAVVNLDFSVNGVLSLRSRVQYSDYDFDDNLTSGIAIIQDLNIKLSKITISTRYAIFDTEDFENRQYVYEKDLLYSFSNPAYSGQGTRNYVMIKYKPSRKLSMWARYGRYNFRNVDRIGSGLTTIEGHTRSDIKFQVMMKF